MIVTSVTRAGTGNYTCAAANSEGKHTSNPVYLDVRCKLIQSEINRKATQHDSSPKLLRLYYLRAPLIAMRFRFLPYLYNVPHIIRDKCS